MRKNLGEPKTSADLDEINKDIDFRKLWNMEHPTKVYDKSDDKNNYEIEVTPTATIVSTNLSGVDESMIEKYSKGETIMEKMGFEGGGLDPRGEGPWFPIVTPLLPKCGEKSIIGVESSNSSKKGTTHSLASPFQFVRVSNPPYATTIGGDGMGTNTSCLEQVKQQDISHKRTIVVDTIQNPSDQGIVKKQKVMTTMASITSIISIIELPLQIYCLQLQNKPLKRVQKIHLQFSVGQD